MPRACVSPADQALINELAELDVAVTRYQLERWRHRGLLPRALVTHHGTGSRVTLTDDSLDIAHILGSFSGRGHDWQRCTILLYEYGYVPSETCLRETGTWILTRQDRALLRMSETVSRAPSTDDLDAVETFLTAMAKRRGARPLRHSLLEVIRSRHPHLSQRELRERADAAEVWTTYFLINPKAPRDLDLLATADGYSGLAEARSHGWSLRDRISLQRIRAVAPTVSRPEMLALSRWYDYLEDKPGFEYIDRGASRFEHALADVAMFRRQHSRNLRTPVNPRVIYDAFDLYESPPVENPTQ